MRIWHSWLSTKNSWHLEAVMVNDRLNVWMCPFKYIVNLPISAYTIKLSLCQSLYTHNYGVNTMIIQQSWLIHRLVQNMCLVSVLKVCGWVVVCVWCKPNVVKHFGLMLWLWTCVLCLCHGSLSIIREGSQSQVWPSFYTPGTRVGSGFRDWTLGVISRKKARIFFSSYAKILGETKFKL